jgi:L-alanine-DL-glutamate epimerase-like enolase superfamily enzyme
MNSAFGNLPKPREGKFTVPTGPGLGLSVNDAELEKRRN